MALLKQNGNKIAWHEFPEIHPSNFLESTTDYLV